MKKSLIAFITLCACINLYGQVDLAVKITHIKKIHGQVEICLYDSEENYMKDGKAMQCVWVDVEKDFVDHVFSSLPKGNYAVVTIHDVNGNKDLDTNFMGIPKEPYGFSNNPSTRFGPPTFEGASVALSTHGKVEIRLK